MSEMVDEIRLSLIDLKEDLLFLESEISEHTAKEEKVKLELSKKKNEAEENKQALEELKEKQVLFSSVMDSQSVFLAEYIQRQKIDKKNSTTSCRRYTHHWKHLQ